MLSSNNFASKVRRELGLNVVRWPDDYQLAISGLKSAEVATSSNFTEAALLYPGRIPLEDRVAPFRHFRVWDLLVRGIVSSVFALIPGLQRELARIPSKFLLFSLNTQLISLECAPIL